MHKASEATFRVNWTLQQVLEHEAEVPQMQLMVEDADVTQKVKKW